MKEVREFITKKVQFLSMMSRRSGAEFIAQQCSIDYKKALELYDKHFNIKDKSKKAISGKRVLVVGDMHEPFCLDTYLAHCLKVYKEESCDFVLFIGDIIDNHASSYHESEIGAMNASEEFDLSKKKIKNWYKAFPNAVVVMGNHDTIPTLRKGKSAIIAPQFFKSFSESLETPNWDFVSSITIDNVLYVHGVGKKALPRSKVIEGSVVQGHYHSEAYCIQSLNSKGENIIAMQVGCGVDNDSYAMTYGANYSPPKHSCGVIYQGKRGALFPL